MKKVEKINEIKLPEELEKIIADTSISWERSKEDIWKDMERKITNNQPAIGKKRILPSYVLYMAAGIALLACLSTFAAIYTKTIYVPSGTHMAITLPDDSRVNLNSGSELSYKPLSWFVTRRVTMEGEAFFNVKKGRKFDVISQGGKTSVLGTSFNIYSRANDYNVVCITGTVRVSSASGMESVVLTPGEMTSINSQMGLNPVSSADTMQIKSWQKNMISYNSVPLEKVFKELERQYDITVEFPSGLAKTWSGAINIDSMSAEDALINVCRPFDLEVTRKSDKKYVIRSYQVE